MTLSDVTVHLCTVQQTTPSSSSVSVSRKRKALPSGSRSKAAKASEGASGSAAPVVDADADTYARSLRCHAIVLANASPYFRARIIRCSGSSSGAQPFASDAMPGSAGGIAGSLGGGAGMVLVEHVEEEELDAMEALLRHCYSSKLQEAGEDGSQLSISEMLQIMVLSDRCAC